jgi:hypothetical protein
MARKPPNLEWLGFTDEQAKLLDFLDYLGNNGWSGNSQTDEIMPKVLAECWQAGLTMQQVQQSMKSIGYSPDALHQLERWESKRATGRFGR